ncbi:MAG: preprotein translocase subunit SecY [Oscillospiraceae bacterium]|nr:preprotein translocase subunit SecY [Oscillospiraceae bacterium]
MLKTLRNAFAIPDLRKKIFFTLLIVVVFRLGAAVPVPFLDPSVLKAYVQGVSAGEGGTGLVSYLSNLSGGAFENATLFTMGITPYINSSIIMQLLTVAIPALERMQKEEDGRKKIAALTRYVTIVLGLVQAFAYYMFIKGSGALMKVDGAFYQNFYVPAVIILVITAGTALMMWFGEQINQFGLGNGISMLLFASIVARGPTAFYTMYYYLRDGIAGISGNGDVTKLIYVPAITILFLGVVAFIVFMNSAERRIPVQYAKRVVGRKVYGGQSTHMPIKINMSGVMPLIFASSILMVPSTLSGLIYGSDPTRMRDGVMTGDLFWYKTLNFFHSNSYVYSGLTFLLVLAFAYFYVAIQYNPVEMANNLRKNSGTVPGIRPGKPTSDFISKIISRITLIGALLLSVVAILPNLLSAIFKVNLGMGGTSIIILVGVALDTVQALESQMLMRHYKGFLE